MQCTSASRIKVAKSLAALASAATITIGFVTPAYAIDGASAEYGNSWSKGVDVQRVEIALQWNWHKRWLNVGNWHLGGYWEVDAGTWNNHSANKTNTGFWDVGVTPVFRLQQTDRSSVSPYLDWAIGAHLLSKTSVSGERRFSTGYQFGDLLGVGIRFGPRGAYDLSLRGEHFSNGDIKLPNNGINFYELRLGYWF